MRVMISKSTIVCATIGLLLFISGAAVSQDRAKDTRRVDGGIQNLGRTYAITLTAGPSDNLEGLTIMTAEGRFMFSTVQTSGEARTSLSFQGELRRGGKGAVLVEYTLGVENVTSAGHASHQLNLSGSVLVPLDTEVAIAKSKDRSFKVKIIPAKN